MRLFVTFLLLLWYLIATYWYVCEINQNNCSCLPWRSANVIQSTPLLINDGEVTVANSNENFYVYPNRQNLGISDSMQGVLQQLQHYLAANPNKQLQVLGQYSPEEKYTGNENNIGVARAKALKMALVTSGADAASIITGAQLVPNFPIDKDSISGAFDFNWQARPVKPRPKVPATALVQEKDTLLFADKPIVFPQSSAMAQVDKSISTQFPNIVQYLTADSTVKLHITGYHTTSEKNPSSFDNLGKARAEYLREALIRAGAPTNKIETKGIAKNDMLASNDSMYAAWQWQIDKPSAPPPALPPVVVILDGKDTIATATSNFMLQKSSAEVPITTELQKPLNTLAQYIKNNPDRELQVIGKYAPTETNPTKFKNLGAARANVLKQAIIKAGADPKRVSVLGKADGKLQFTPEGAKNGIEFKLKVTKELIKNLQQLSRKLYFQSGSFDLAITPELEKYFKDVKTYLEQAPAAKVQLTGHTDDVGDAKTNKTLGLDRAKRVKTALTKIQIDANRISLASEGEDKPTTSNATEAGKAKNRRVEMLIK